MNLFYSNCNKIAVFFGLASLFIFFTPESSAITYYSYQSGNWGTANTWTTDASGTSLVGPAVPANSDNVVILNGRTVNLAANVATTGHSVDINSGGILNLSIYTITTITSLDGAGKLKIGASYFPAVTTNNFITTSGSTVEYYDFGAPTTLPTSPATYYNLTLSNSTASSYTMRLDANLTVNGDFIVTKTGAGTLTFSIGASAAARTLTFADDVTIGSGCTMNVGAFAAIHGITISGDLTNNGTIDLTNSAQYAAATEAANLTFTGASDATMACNGTTDVYTLTLNKGADQTYILEITSTSTSNFTLNTNTTCITLTNGTLKLGSNISLTRLTAAATDYNISTGSGATAGLWINGADVLLDGTSTSVTVYGKFRISSGNFSIGNQGLVLGPVGEIVIEGGTSTVEKLRTLSNATYGSAFTMSGGTLNVDATPTGSSDANQPRFSMPAAGQAFTMSGGTINVKDPETVTAIGGGFLIASTNTSVSGGTTNFYIPASADNFIINSTASFYDLNILKAGAGAGTARLNDQAVASLTAIVSPIAAQPLVVLNDFVITTGNTPTFDVTPPATDQNVTVGGNFNIQASTTYTPGNNTTTFNGTGNQIFTVSGTITTALNNLTVNKTAGTLTLAGANITVNGTLAITAGTFSDGGFTIDAKSSISNSGTHASTGAGKLSLSGTSAQTITSTSGSFGNLYLDNATGADGTVSVTLTGNASVTGTLTLNQSNLFDISSYNLAMGSSATFSPGGGAYGTTRFIRTGGVKSDGGITKTFSSTSAVTFPFGFLTIYQPAIITINSAPTTYGNMTLKPVDGEHPNVTATGKTNTSYWQITSSGFTLGAATVSYSFEYQTSELVQTEADCGAARFDPSAAAWAKGAITDVVDASNLANAGTILVNTAYASGDFVVGCVTGCNGANEPFGTVVVYYSRVSPGDFNNKNDYTTNPDHVTVSAPTGNVDATTFIEIASGHTVVVDGNSQVCGTIRILNGGVLDINTRTGTSLGRVVLTTDATESGTIKIGAANFPAGDCADFLQSGGGTVEYNGAGSYTIPVTAANYNNLVLTPATGQTLTMPNINLPVYGNMTVQGGSITGIAALNAASAKSLTIGGNLSITSGILRYKNAFAQTVTVGGNVVVSSGAKLDVDVGGAAAQVNNSLSIVGNLTNTGTGIVDLFENSATTHFCDVTFTGTGNTSISGTGATTDFNTITVNKGSSQSPILTVSSSNFTLSGAVPNLILTNGTFKLTTATTISPATGAFTIPSTACLSSNGGTINLCTAAADASDVTLNGKIEVLAGTVNIGTSGNNNNNDIEYAAAGTPTIDVQGGTLNVNGQIRRGTGTTSGSLTYSQSGTGTVLIRGRNMEATRAMLEVANSGIFNMSGTSTLTLERAGGTTYGDLYLLPASNTVTGGTVIIGNASTPASQTFIINSTASINDLTVNTTSSPIAQLTTNGLTILDDLSIQAGAVFDANGLDVNIAGDLTNSNVLATTGVTVGGYRAGTTNQITTFNSTSASQVINGDATPNLTNFGKLVINNTFGSVTLAANTAVRVNGDLALSNGTFAGASNIITVIGNISNSATHSSTTGSISLEGTGIQTISGNGSGVFGSITLNNAAGAVLSANSTVNGAFNFTSGIFNIGDKLLTLGSSSTVSGATAAKCIQLNGALGDEGITKNYPSGASDFTFPIGVSGKYTPVQYNVTANGAVGTINIRPVNVKYPLTTDASNLELTYYWHTTSSGFSGLTLTHVYNYATVDVNGTETSYRTGRNVLGTWTPGNGTPGTVDDVANTMTLAGVNYIDGDYTAGEISEFGVVPTYYSRNATLGGNWDDGNSWSIVSHAGAAAGSYPLGEPAIIASGHTIVANGDARASQFTTISGTLDLGNYVGHNLGVVSGTGTIKMSPTAFPQYVFPAGALTTFVSAAGGTIEYAGGTGVLPSRTTYRNLTLSGTGTKTMANGDITLSGTFAIDGTTTLDNTDFNNDFNVAGDWTQNSGTTLTMGTGVVTFNGSGAQTINGTQASQSFKDVIINKSAGTLSSSATTLTFENLTQTAGNFDASGATTALNINGNLVLTAGTFTAPSVTNIKGNWTKATAATFTPGAGTVNFTGTGAQAINGTSTAQTFYNVALAKTAGQTLSIGGSTTTLTVNNLTQTTGNFNASGASTALNIDGSLALTAGTFTAPTTTTIDGDWAYNGGTFTPGTGTVRFTGSGAQAIGGSTNSSFYNLTIANSGNTVTLNRNATITNLLDFTTSGYISLNAKDLIISNWTDANIPSLGTNRDRYVIVDATGYFKINNVNSGETARFPIGTSSTNTDFCRVDIANSDAANTSFDVNACNYINTAGTCSGGTQITGDAVNISYQTVSSSVNATITLYWDISREIGGFTRANCQVNHYAAGVWGLIGTAGASTNLAGNVYSRSASTTSFSPFGVSRGGSPLPIELLSFSADYAGKNVNLKWSTATETNNDYFTIEKSLDGTNFEIVSIVDGAGNSSTQRNYQTVDDNPYDGISYYRLKQTDFDGQFAYSNLRVVEVKEGSIFSGAIFPNPSDGESLFLKISPGKKTSKENVLVILYDIQGKEVYSKINIIENTGSQIIAIDPLQKLIPGIYFVTATSDMSIYKQTLVVR